MKTVPHPFLIYNFLASHCCVFLLSLAFPTSGLEPCLTCTALGRVFPFTFPNWEKAPYQTQSNRELKAFQHIRELWYSHKFPSESSCSGAFSLSWIPLQVWLGNPRKLQIISIYIASICFGQRKDMPFSSALLLPLDEGEEQASTAKTSAFMINIVLWHMILVQMVTNFTGIHTLLWGAHLVNPYKLRPALHRAELDFEC